MDVKGKKKKKEEKSKRNKKCVKTMKKGNNYALNLCMCVDRSEARKISSEHIRGMRIEARGGRGGGGKARAFRVFSAQSGVYIRNDSAIN